LILSKKNKLEKFLENRESPNVIEPDSDVFDTIKGKWKSFFQNDNKIIVELACGWGEYTVSLAEMFPSNNYIGIDIKGDRIWRGSQYALKNNLKNVAFLRIHINELLKCFDENEVDGVWLTFPDPRPKERDEKHRLCNKHFIRMYQKVLKNDGWFMFKTDNTFLFDYALEVLSDFEIRDYSFTKDLYNSPYQDEHFGIKTKYEKIWTEKGETIKYLKFRFK